MTPEQKEALRGLPQLGALLDRDDVSALCAAHGRSRVKRALQTLLASARAHILAGGRRLDARDLVERAVFALAAAEGTLRPVINATGVIVHTNLGRAPLAIPAMAAATAVAAGYSALEYDLDAGARGSRHGHAVQLLCGLTGAEAAVVVNNCAAAVHVGLAALAAGREVVVSRGELVEIGGGFRVPDVMAQSGAVLREVGTTNRTHARDYADAAGDDTALLLKVHRSNFDVVGFVAEVDVPGLVAVGRDRGVPVMVDAGAGALERLPGCPDERPIKELIAAGADLVCFSGDKLLGGPQAGILVGRADLIERVRRHPMMRAMRPDKLCLAALVETLRLWRDHPAQIPLYAMLHADEAWLQKRAEAIQQHVTAAGGPRLGLRASRARVGGGSTPTTTLPSVALGLQPADVGMAADAVTARLRARGVPVVARVHDGEVWLDLRTVFATEDEDLAAAVVDLGRPEAA